MINSKILSWLKLFTRMAINSATPLVLYPLVSAKLGPEKFILIIQAISIGLLYSIICKGGFNITSISDFSNYKNLNSVDDEIEKLITTKGIIFSYTILPFMIATGVYTIATSNSSQLLTTSIIIATSGISGVLDLAWILEIYGHYSSLLLISSISTISAFILIYIPGLTAFSLIAPTLISAFLTCSKTCKENSNIRFKRILTNILSIDIRAFNEKKNIHIKRL